MAAKNPNMAAQDMPPEFKFRPTKIYYDAPPRSIIYEDALGSSGKAPLDDRLARLMDPIHWQSGRSPVANMEQTSNGVISRLTHQFRHSQTPRTVIRKHEQRKTINTIKQEPPGLRQPRVSGNRTPQQVAAGAKKPAGAVKPPPDINKIAMITDPRRGFRVGSRRSFMQYLMQASPDSIDAIAKKAELAAEKREQPTTTIGGYTFTEQQLQVAPPGLIKVMVDRETQRLAKQPKPRVMFDPRESKGAATHGQFTTQPRPGLVEVEPGKYVRPEQMGMQAADVAVPMGSNGQPLPAKGTWKSAALALGFLGLGIAGLVLVAKG